MDYTKLEENLNTQIGLYHSEYKISKIKEKKKIDELVELWTTAGLVDESMDYRLKIILTNSLESLSHYMLSNLSAGDCGEAESSIFPAARAVVVKTKEEIENVRLFYTFYAKAYQKYRANFDDVDFKIFKAEIMEDFSKIFVDEYIKIWSKENSSIINDVEITEVPNKKNSIIIFEYHGDNDPVEKIDEAIKMYMHEVNYKEFVDSNMDNPWMRIVIASDKTH